MKCPYMTLKNLGWGFGRLPNLLMCVDRSTNTNKNPVSIAIRLGMRAFKKYFVRGSAENY